MLRQVFPFNLRFELDGHLSPHEGITIEVTKRFAGPFLQRELIKVAVAIGEEGVRERRVGSEALEQRLHGGIHGPPP